MRREGRCFNCKRRKHISTTCLENKKIKKIVRVVRATSSSTKEKKKARKARKERSSSKEELGGIETLDKNRKRVALT